MKIQSIQSPSVVYEKSSIDIEVFHEFKICWKIHLDALRRIPHAKFSSNVRYSVLFKTSYRYSKLFLIFGVCPSCCMCEMLKFIWVVNSRCHKFWCRRRPLLKFSLNGLLSLCTLRWKFSENLTHWWFPKMPKVWLLFENFFEEKKTAASGSSNDSYSAESTHTRQSMTNALISFVRI